MTRIKATVITDAGERVTLDMVCTGSSQAHNVIDALYPEHRYASVIVVRQQEGQPCR